MSGVFLGLFMVGGGLLFLLRNMGVLYIDNIGAYWPVILLVIGASKLVWPRHNGSIGTGVVMLVIGGVFLLRNLGILYGNVSGYIWPLIFIAIGCSMLFRRSFLPGPWSPGPAGGVFNADTLYSDILFGGLQPRVVSQDFQGGKVSVVFGGAEIDLRGAAIQRPNVTLQLDAVFGGIEVIVPTHWQVSAHGTGVFGAFEDRTAQPAAPPTGTAPQLSIRGGAVFGGVTIRN
jgi:predicted membrane protein